MYIPDKARAPRERTQQREPHSRGRRDLGRVHSYDLQYEIHVAHARRHVDFSAEHVPVRTRTGSESNRTKATRLLGVDACVAVAPGLHTMMRMTN
jgi:hypothetical protein